MTSIQCQLFENPTYWRHFFRYIWKSPDRRDIKILINEGLVKYNAFYTTDGDTLYFESEEDAIRFMLEWA